MSDLKVWDMAGQLVRLFEQYQVAPDDDGRALVEAQIGTWFAEMGDKVDVYHDVLGRLYAEHERQESEATAMAARAKVTAGRIDWFEGKLLSFVQAHGSEGGTTLKGAGELIRFKAIQNPGGCNVVDEGSIPARFIDIIPAERKIRKGDILRELRKNIPIPGAELKRTWKLERK